MPELNWFVNRPRRQSFILFLSIQLMILLVDRAPKTPTNFEDLFSATASEEEDEKIQTYQEYRSRRWAVEGISARRKRNQGRLRNLEKLRVEKRSYIPRSALAKMKLESRTKSGQLVLKVDKVSKSFGDHCIIRNFSIQIKKGDRIGIVGPNGIGKTTLLKMLLGEINPDSGTAKLGSNLIVAKFDQMREQLNLKIHFGRI